MFTETNFESFLMMVVCLFALGFLIGFRTGYHSGYSNSAKYAEYKQTLDTQR